MSVSLSTHVLDTAAGRPAAGVRVELFAQEERLAAAETAEDGRIEELFRPPSPFFVRVELEVELGDGHHHVPLVVSPYGCASYRGS